MILATKTDQGFKCHLCDYSTDLELEEGHKDIIKHLSGQHNRIMISFNEELKKGIRKYEGPYNVNPFAGGSRGWSRW